jgi:hypothetical protein
MNKIKRFSKFYNFEMRDNRSSTKSQIGLLERVINFTFDAFIQKINGGTDLLLSI